MILNQEDGDSALLQHTLERDGVLIIIKENIYVLTADLGGNIVLFNEEYSSVTMLILSFIQLHHHQKCSSVSLRIFCLVVFHLGKQDLQRGFDPDLQKVDCYALHHFQLTINMKEGLKKIKGNRNPKNGINMVINVVLIWRLQGFTKTSLAWERFD
ncbi:hypothetical protein VP01_3911g4 [Puccinia sorghi]|uniref:Uncharacterized protein n=1 Tax=Puccinia sorghi TaxID=27349 RepID=A0A0L6USL6_9BASI|nr:hypothetical protein VP01_3911g4 [Puccinia sorghi]